MTEQEKPDEVEPKARSKKTGCLTGCLTGLVIWAAIFSWAVWQAGEPGRRASAVRKAVRPGMPVAEVEAMLTGRPLCFYQFRTNEQWETVSREEMLAVAPGSTNVERRVMLTFLGMTPARTTFTVEVDASGGVIGTTRPYTWD